MDYNILLIIYDQNGRFSNDIIWCARKIILTLGTQGQSHLYLKLLYNHPDFFLFFKTRPTPSNQEHNCSVLNV